MNGLTAAHNELPLGTLVRVTNLRNDQEVVLRINDRGPAIPGRLLDVSFEAARRLDFVQSGLAYVQIEVLDSSKGSGALTGQAQATDCIPTADCALSNLGVSNVEAIPRQGIAMVSAE